MSSIAPDALARRLAGGDEPVVLDIRHADEYEEWHIPNSTNIEVYEAVRSDPPAAKAALRSLPDDEEVVTVCGIGMVSQTATELLDELGYDATTLEEGMLGWSQVHRWATVGIDAPGTLIQVARPGKGCLSYVLISDGAALVVDPSQYAEEYDAVVDAFDAELVGVAETHAHADHLSGARELAEAHEVPYFLHPADAIDIAVTPIADGETLRVGQLTIEVVHTPGHSPGGVTFDIAGEALLTGDTLFHESVGRVELGATVGIDDADIEANAEQLFESIQTLLGRDDDVLVLPAHDPDSPEPPVVATLAEIRRNNPDCGGDRVTFVDELAGSVTELPPNVHRIKLANVGLEPVEPAERTTLELGPNRCAAE